jgi:type IV pilus assembly protein PilB
MDLVEKVPTGAKPARALTVDGAVADAPCKTMRENDWYVTELRRLGFTENQISTTISYANGHAHKNPIGFLGACTLLGIISHREVPALIAKYWGLTHITSNDLVIQGESHKLLPAPIQRGRVAIPLSINGRMVRVAVANPGILNFSQVEHSLRDQGLTPYWVVAPLEDIVRKIEEVNTPRILVGTEDAGATYVEKVIEEAWRDGASDVHFVPNENGLWIEFRINGRLTPKYPFPADKKEIILAGVKIMSSTKKREATAGTSTHMDIANKSLPQDASTSRKYGSARVNLRFSSLPTIWGESIGVRILDQSKGGVPLHELGMGQDMLQALIPLLRKGTGGFILTGPTGSGKTTTLYSMSNALEWRANGLSFFTLENPVEYEMGMGARQTEVTDRLTWSVGLRAILRQDPDILLIGEMRDAETAAAGVRTAMTGHMFFTTLHANHTIECFARLMDLGVEPGNIVAAITVFIAQRLVRRVCPRCRRPHRRNDDLLRQYADVLRDSQIPQPRFWEAGPGCPECKTGFGKQFAIFEMLPVWPFADLIIRKKIDATPADFADIIERYNQRRKEIADYRVQKGQSAAEAKYGVREATAAPIRSLEQDGILRAASGHTTPEEVLGAI